MEDCDDYAVGGAVAAARPVIGNILRTSGSKGEAIKGVTRHLERRRDTGFGKKEVHSNDMKMSTAQKRAQARVVSSTPVLRSTPVL